MASDDLDSTRAQLSQLADELRTAGIDAVAARSPFAPTLDDCRVDVERLLAAPLADVLERHSIILRSALALGTWRRILAARHDAAPARCPSCREGARVVVARAGRVVAVRGTTVELPGDFAIPTCDRCGAESLDAETAARLDALLFRTYAGRS
jgi:hypothetical protein